MKPLLWSAALLSLVVGAPHRARAQAEFSISRSDADGVQLPAQAVALDQGPLSLSTQPAGLALRSGGVAYVHEQGGASAPFGRAGDALFVSVGGLRTGSLSAWSAGLSAEWLRPVNGGCTGSAPCAQRLSLGIAWGRPSLAVGAAWRWLQSGQSAAVDRVGLLDAGVTWRPAAWLSVAATGQALNNPRQLASQGTFGVAVRPLGPWATVAADLGVADAGGRSQLRASYLAAFEGGGWRLAAELAQAIDGPMGLPAWAAQVSLQAALGQVLATGGAGGVSDAVGWHAAAEFTFDPGASAIPVPPRAQRLELASALSGPPPWVQLLGLDDGPGAEARLLLRLVQAEKDPSLDVLVLELRSLAGFSMGRVEELRDRLAALRRSGKRVLAWLGGGGDATYYLASAADRIVVAPQAALELNGLSSQRYYLRGLLQKMGIEPEFVTVGDYKSAPEQFTREGPSPAAMEAGESQLDDVFNRYVAAVARERRITAEQFTGLLARGVMTGEQARAAGLVDAVSPAGESLREEVARLAGRPLPWGVLGSAGVRPVLWGEPPRVALVELRGQIVPGGSRREAGADRLAWQLRAAGRDPQVRAVVLRVESPGGDVTASEQLWQAVREVARTKPVVASLGDVAASGGYYVASGATQIVAEPSTLTGSIGVFAGKADLSGLLGRWGVTTHAFRRGEASDQPTVARPWTPAERQSMQRLIEDFYNTFLQRVAEGRNMEPSQVDAVARGRVWTGAQAKDCKLVDRLGGLAEALALAHQLAGLAPSQAVVVPGGTGLHLAEGSFSAPVAPDPSAGLSSLAALLSGHAGLLIDPSTVGVSVAMAAEAAEALPEEALLEALAAGTPMALAWELPVWR